LPERRKICVITGTRAEYGLLNPLMKELDAAPDVELQIIACAMHLSPEYGETYKTIEQDGFSIDAKVEMLLSGDTPSAITKSIGLGCIGFADTLERLAPDIVILLGDRFEALAAAQAALIARIPVAHLHGGEGTEGNIDEGIRHSITKMAHLHFTAAEDYRRRVIQLGENPERVYNFGAPGIDSVYNLDLLDRESLSASIGFDIQTPYFSLTYHPVTLVKEKPSVAISELIAALEHFPDHKVVITAPNADTNGRNAFAALQALAKEAPQRFLFAVSLGQIRYLSLMKHAEAVIGNSSSGMIEAPALGTPTVNLGPRQRGRQRAPSVIDCEENESDIRAAIEQAVSADYLATIMEKPHPFGNGTASPRIAKILRTANLDGIIFKAFYDLPVTS
jgi:UDP-hydrolysing UDP-N-acetyl-D-glucosamine 2-epimerase